MQTRLSLLESSRMRPDLESAIEYLPGLASLALWCRFADTDEKTIAYTDGSTIFAGAEYEDFNPKERKFICLHEILHIALCHPSRLEALEKQDLSFNLRLLNIAADAIINGSLENLTGLETPSRAWTLERIWQALEKCDEDNKSAEKQAVINAVPNYHSFSSSASNRKIANLTKAELPARAAGRARNFTTLLKHRQKFGRACLRFLSRLTKEIHSAAIYAKASLTIKGKGNTATE